MRYYTKKIQTFVVFVLLYTLGLHASIDPGLIAPLTFDKIEVDSLLQVEEVQDSIKTNQLIILNEAVLSSKTEDSNSVNKTLAVLYGKNNNPVKASEHIMRYMRSTEDMSILNDHVFSKIKDSSEFKDLKVRYKAKLGFLPFIYAFTGIFGFFIFIFLNSRKSSDKIAVLLISSFVLFHSLFILHLSLYVSRYHLQIPHSLYASTPFSFLYGPLLYFYFKRVVNHHRFNWKDAFHLIPSLALFGYLIPYYTMNSYEKFLTMFDHTKHVLPGTKVIIIVKILSLGFYAWATYRVYREQYRNEKLNTPENALVKMVWERNVLTIFVSYFIAYVLYGAAVTKIINYTPFLNLQIIVMLVMVFYIATISFLQPEVFKGQIRLEDISSLFKYRKSGLTSSYSKELKEELLSLMDKQKVFKQNDISLDALAEMLGTTRHNASQVINEHFKMSFYDLINLYRINEAKRIFESDTNRNLNIIEVAYEVGYNNKVTFNKAFKKQLNATPSEFINQAADGSGSSFLKRA